MKAAPDCITCMFEQALRAARSVTDDADVHFKVLTETARIVASLDLDQNPSIVSQPAYEALTRITGIEDPYASQKKEANAAVLAFLPTVEARIAGSDDPLKVAVHAAVAGNIIDLGAVGQFDIKRDLDGILEQAFAIDDTELLRQELRPGRKLLYLGDNAGEIVFDTVLVRELLKAELAVTYVVKSGPIINDATMADAEESGMTDLVPVMETGSSDIGVHWDNASSELLMAIDNADIIVGKGHGNFETCVDRPENFYFLLKAKCMAVARELNVAEGDLVFKKARTGAGETE